MTELVSQSILDALTDVEFPRRMAARAVWKSLPLDGMRLPVYRGQALVLGSGAAGLRAAVELKRRKIDVVVATQTLFWGTSVCSGSDKQTLHTASTGASGDDFLALARALGAGGAMDADTAYVEAVGSVEALMALKYLGLPLPEDCYGGVLRYRTDHDEAGRATSCGPRTSRLMAKVLAEEALRLGVPFVNRCTGLKLIRGKDGSAAGLLVVKADARGPDNPYGLALFQCPAVVLATGGPGELYRDSVYPVHCFGSLGMALEAGIELVNLSESQFGIGTRREGFPWNLSGTYVQAMPYLYSVDSSGSERNFLADYYRTTGELASNVFRKGYQWPFHAMRTLDFQSSLVDLAVYRESRAGRTVYMDFRRNPERVPQDAPFSLDRLDADVAAYLKNNDAWLPLPIERLRRMNPLAIELYRRHRVDLDTAPLPFDINNQHMNGGIAVDIWAQSSLPGCYAVGEAAGTHGVTRPGGAALNAGQVFGIRCAEHIHARWSGSGSTMSAMDDEPFLGAAGECAALIRRDLKNPEALRVEDVKKEIQARMSEQAGFICHDTEVAGALERALALNASVREQGIRIENPAQIAKAMLWRQMALTSAAVLSALSLYIGRNGGSRGARLICSASGTEVPDTKNGKLEEYRFLPERDADRKKQIRVRYEGGRFEAHERELRSMTSPGEFFFEKNWAPFLSGRIYEKGYPETLRGPADR
ncbi:MAG: FAD-binding protein [Candidatus Accumulibacter sp.]|jgi:succinate dehydrogenase/fumarate reductase flavoprotein subunit|nr:FAD-binding protein [Accumulibacter sp.]